MADIVNSDDFAEWPLERQLEHLEETLSLESLPRLWQLCFPSMDSKPMVHLVALTVQRGIALPGAFLLQLRPSTLAVVLATPALSSSVEEAWQSASLGDLVSFCLLDRYLRRQATSRWETLVRQVEVQAASLLADNQAPGDGLLMRLQGSQQRSLQARFPKAWQSWNEAWRAAARSAIRILAERPRDVSQANAERLLSQQVYTDPGHFLLELLQNADDAQATEFTIEFNDDALVVSHNGEPFDFRDLVGLLSIGQTTKKSTQIGYFGVGFKSVYEVTERPRLHSGHFSFEIADVSVPRALAPHEDALRTVLALPLKPGLRALDYWLKALEIQPALLLNVPHLRRIVWKGPEVVEISLSEAEAEVVVLRHGTQESRFLRWSGTYRHRGPRPTGKPAQAALGLAIPVDGKVPATSLYSFLPISEDSGLKFIVGSHFDVPVDRERLDLASEWNQGVIDSIAPLVAERFARDLEDAWQLLPLMPLPDDALGPLFTRLPGQLAESLKTMPLLPGRRQASQVALLHPDLISLVDLEQEPTLVFTPDDRRRQWLQMLGAGVYGVGELLADLSAGTLRGHLQRRDPADWTLLHGLLLNLPKESLRTVPILLDADREPLAPDRALLLGPEWKGLFPTPPRSVHPELASPGDSAALLSKLAVPSFDWAHLVQELKENGTANVLDDELFARLAEAPRGVTLACLALPIFADQHGVLGSLVPPAARHLGIVAGSPDLPRELLPGQRFLATTPPLERLLEALRWPRFDLPSLVEALDWSSISEAHAESLLLAVERSEAAWTAPVLERLAGLSVFASSSGERLPLSQLWRFEDADLQRLLLRLPSLQSESSSHRVVRKLDLRYRLSSANLETLLDAMAGPSAVDPQGAVEYLAANSGRLSRGQVESLFQLPLFAGQRLIWPDQAGPGVMAAKPDYVDLFTALGRDVLDRATTESIVPLLRAAAYPLLGLTHLVENLEASAPPALLLPQLQAKLLQESANLQLAFSVELRQALPIWLARSGRVVAARDIPPNDELASLVGRQEWLPGAPVDPALAQLFAPLESDVYLRRLLSREAKIGQPLSLQPAWCNSVAKIDQVAGHLPLAYLMVSADGVLRDHALHHAPSSAYSWLLRSPLASELIHPESSAEQKRDCAPLDSALILETYFLLRNEPAMRQDFYRFLQAELGAVANQPDGRAFLLEAPLWRSAGGRWKSLDQLILDPEIPDLGGDWSPHSEIPASLLHSLESVLGVGRPDPLTLMEEHLLPAYLERPSLRASILGVLARLAGGVETSKLRRALRGKDGLAAFPLPDGSELGTCYHPPEDLPSLPRLPAAPSEQLAFLRRLGLRYLPDARGLEGVASSLTSDDGDALLRLVEWAWQQQPDELEPLWGTLSSIAWMPARDGRLKLSRQLFLRTPEIEELIGSSPDLFVQRRLPVGLARRLGLKEESELDGALVLGHLRRLVAKGERASGRIYAYLEESLRSGRISSFYLLEQLKELAWVWTDEGEYRQARYVLTVPAFRFFGPHRGTWEGATERYPQLATLFSIPASVTPEVVTDFLRQVHETRELQPSRRLLRACLTLLGDHDVVFPRHWQVIPASIAATDHPLVVAAEEVGLVRSNSPTLSSLFAQAGRLLLVDPGDAESAPSLDKLYQSLGIQRLRDAYTVRPDRSSREVGAHMADAVVAFRGLLRNLAGVLPRLRAARPEWDEGEWLVESRLRHFMTSGPIRVLQDLRLTYDLPNVARVAVEAAAAFDPDGKELLMGASALAEPAIHAVALADGLLDLMYQGPASEGLVDLLNLLIPLGRREAMESYLDRRHFPRPSQEIPPQGLGERVGEILDYGLHKLLERRFPELAGSDWSRWRQPNLELPSLAEAAARTLLGNLGQVSPSAELVEALSEMLATERLETVIAPLWEADPSPSSTQPSPVSPAGSEGGHSAGPAGSQPRPSLVARQATAPPAGEAVAAGIAAHEATAPSGLAGVGQKMLGRLGQWLGVGTPGVVEGLSFQRPITDVAETYQHPPERHLLVSSKALKGQDLYCVSSLGVDFDPRRQWYLPAEVPWTDSFVASGRSLEFSGRLTPPGQVLPKPLFSRLSRPPAVRGGRASLRGPDKLGLHRISLDNPHAEIAYAVELGVAPELDDVAPLMEVDPRLLKPTAPLSALPPLVVDWVSWARSSNLPAWHLAQRARDFVTAHYLYDLTFMESQDMRELGDRPFRGDENRALTLLHAGASGQSLGRGVCLELSAILLEMLRRARVPAVMASVWMLDMGLIHHPDHAIVLVYLPSSRGPTWIPLEPSVSRTDSAVKPEMTRAELLQGAADLVLGPAFHAPSDPAERQRAQEAALLAALGESRRLEVLLESIARSNRYLREVDPELRWLAAKGYLSVEKEELFRVSPSTRRPR